MAKVTMYTTPWCGYCKNLKNQMKRAQIEWDEVDIEQDSAAAKHVEEINGGDQIVPTLEFSDGAALTTPSLKAGQAKLAELD